MNWKELVKLTPLKVTILIILFVVFFFVNIPLLFDHCYWNACPDYINSAEIIAFHPNFYRPAGCGWGLTYTCWDARWDFSQLIFDIILWSGVSLGAVYVVGKVRNNQKNDFYFSI